MGLRPGCGMQEKLKEEFGNVIVCGGQEGPESYSLGKHGISIVVHHWNTKVAWEKSLEVALSVREKRDDTVPLLAVEPEMG